MVPGPLTIVDFDPETGEARPRAAQPERWGDAVIVRKEIPNDAARVAQYLGVVNGEAIIGAMRNAIADAIWRHSCPHFFDNSGTIIVGNYTRKLHR